MQISSSTRAIVTVHCKDVENNVRNTVTDQANQEEQPRKDTPLYQFYPLDQSKRMLAHREEQRLSTHSPLSPLFHLSPLFRLVSLHSANLGHRCYFIGFLIASSCGPLGITGCSLAPHDIHFLAHPHTLPYPVTCSRS